LYRIGNQTEGAAVSEESSSKPSSGARAGGCLAGLAICFFPFIILSFNGNSPTGFQVVGMAPLFLLVGGVIGLVSLLGNSGDDSESEAGESDEDETN
jgi:hypothetical protein